MKDSPVIQFQDLGKTYRNGWRGKHVEALRGISFDVQRGEIFGLIGPNGAGKTTAIKVLLGIAKQSRGQASLFGQPAGDRRGRQKVGYLPENLRVPRHHTAATALEFYGRLSGLSRRDAKKRSGPLLDDVGLGDWKTVSVRKYSKGMLQRLGMAQAMLHQPDLLVLDEPTDGLDPLGRKHVRELLIKLKKNGKTVFLNSHLLAEVEMICDRVAILKQGEVCYVGRVDEISRPEKENKEEISLQLVGSPESIRTALKPWSVEAWPAESTMPWQINIKMEKQNDIDTCVDALRASGVSIVSLSRCQATLEDAFIEMVQS